MFKLFKKMFSAPNAELFVYEVGSGHGKEGLAIKRAVVNARIDAIEAARHRLPAFMMRRFVATKSGQYGLSLIMAGQSTRPYPEVRKAIGWMAWVAPLLVHDTDSFSPLRLLRSRCTLHAQEWENYLAAQEAAQLAK